MQLFILQCIVNSEKQSRLFPKHSVSAKNICTNRIFLTTKFDLSLAMTGLDTQEPLEIKNLEPKKLATFFAILQIMYKFIALNLCIVLLAFFSSVEGENAHSLRLRAHPVNVSCGNDSSICGINGICTNFQCFCDSGFVSRYADQPCQYSQKSQTIAFIISFIVGSFGADWFYLSSGNAGYIVAGVFKLITLGGCGIWWLVDWIRVLTDGFPDGNGFGLNNNL